MCHVPVRLMTIHGLVPRWAICAVFVSLLSTSCLLTYMLPIQIPKANLFFENVIHSTKPKKTMTYQVKQAIFTLTIIGRKVVISFSTM